MTRTLVVVTVLFGIATRSPAPPPMATGDVPTAGKGMFELYAGVRYQESESGRPTRQLPFTELVYGISHRQEITFETAYLSANHEHGFGDSVIGTKYVFLKEAERLPGIAGSFELKLPTGSESKGLGTGEFDYDIRLRSQKTWGWFTAIGNFGYTFLTDLEFGGVTTRKDNVSGSQELIRMAPSRACTGAIAITQNPRLTLRTGWKHRDGSRGGAI